MKDRGAARVFVYTPAQRLSTTIQRCLNSRAVKVADSIEEFARNIEHSEEATPIVVVDVSQPHECCGPDCKIHEALSVLEQQGKALHAILICAHDVCLGAAMNARRLHIRPEEIEHALESCVHLSEAVVHGNGIRG